MDQGGLAVFGRNGSEIFLVNFVDSGYEKTGYRSVYSAILRR